MNNSILVHFEDVFKYSRVGGISKGMTLHEVGSTLLDIPLHLAKEQEIVEVDAISVDGVSLFFCENQVAKMVITMDEMYESEYLFDFDEWILQELSYLNPDDIAVALMEKNLSFSYTYEEEEEHIVIKIEKSGVKFHFFPLSDGESYLDYELHSIEI